MTEYPKEILEAWEKKEGPVVLTTVSEQGIPNSIYATCVALFDNDKFLVADNLFDKTYKNIMACENAVALFITDEKKAYQLKGTISYKTEGPEFDDMKQWNPPHLAGKGVAVLSVDEIFSGAEKIV